MHLRGLMITNRFEFIRKPSGLIVAYPLVIATPDPALAKNRPSERRTKAKHPARTHPPAVMRDIRRW